MLMNVSALVSLATIENMHRPPRDRAVGDEVVLRVLLLAPDPDAERRRADEIGDEDDRRRAR